MTPLARSAAERLRHLVVRAAQLEREDGLLVLALQQHAVAEPARQRGRELEGRLDRDVVDLRRENLLQVVDGHRHHAGSGCGSAGRFGVDFQREPEAASRRFPVERRQILPVRRQLVGGRREDPQRGARAGIARRGEGGVAGRGERRRHVDRERLLAARHREIDLGQELGVEQRAVHRPVRIVDAEALAERVEAVALAGEHLAREREGVDDARVEIRAPGARHARELGVEKADVERRVVDDPFRAAGELDEFRRDLPELRLALEIVPRHSVHFGRAGIDLALGVEAKVERPPGGAAIGDLERGDLDDPVPELGVEPRGLGVDDDLTHVAGQCCAPFGFARRRDDAGGRMIRRGCQT